MGEQQAAPGAPDDIQIGAFRGGRAMAGLTFGRAAEGAGAVGEGVGFSRIHAGVRIPFFLRANNGRLPF
jgi:hypothetical protein